MLLAHEYTHWIREKEIKHDIFEQCIGERFVTEGIACNFSEEVVPNMPVRTGYVYGYIKVKEYMRKNNLKIKDIIKSDWRVVLNGQTYKKSSYVLFSKR